MVTASARAGRTFSSGIDQQGRDMSDSRNLQLAVDNGIRYHLGSRRAGPDTDDSGSSLLHFDWDQLYIWGTDEVSVPQQPQADHPPSDPSLSLPPTSWDQLYTWGTDEILVPQQFQADHTPSDPSLSLPPTSWDQLYTWGTDDILVPQQFQADHTPSDPSLSLPPTSWDQLYTWGTDEILVPQQFQADHTPSDPSLSLPPTSWDQLYTWGTDEILVPQQPQADHPPNSPGLRISSFVLDQEVGAAIFGGHLSRLSCDHDHQLTQPSPTSRNPSLLWGLENNRQALTTSDAMHRNDSCSPDEAVPVP
ncbi:hypothetical protein N7476_000311 [Penicillium atrosanguineum]|uniref:Uncharacterized protein n=1 Tax=Penicillium atrosanguineum TaxID=1132637 RepID=A0A9W9UC05_9EURO|nr:hypothetical protein N7476_000311 [Penicillium atrosanguineum]